AVATELDRAPSRRGDEQLGAPTRSNPSGEARGARARSRRQAEHRNRATARTQPEHRPQSALAALPDVKRQEPGRARGRAFEAGRADRRFFAPPAQLTVSPTGDDRS